jgi:hypothetical protein
LLYFLELVKDRADREAELDLLDELDYDFLNFLETRDDDDAIEDLMGINDNEGGNTNFNKNNEKGKVEKNYVLQQQQKQQQHEDLEKQQQNNEKQKHFQQNQQKHEFEQQQQQLFQNNYDINQEQEKKFNYYGNQLREQQQQKEVQQYNFEQEQEYSYGHLHHQQQKQPQQQFRPRTASVDNFILFDNYSKYRSSSIDSTLALDLLDDSPADLFHDNDTFNNENFVHNNFFEQICNQNNFNNEKISISNSSNSNTNDNKKIKSTIRVFDNNSNNNNNNNNNNKVTKKNCIFNNSSNNDVPNIDFKLYENHALSLQQKNNSLGRKKHIFLNNNRLNTQITIKNENFDNFEVSFFFF